MSYYGGGYNSQGYGGNSYGRSGGSGGYGYGGGNSTYKGGSGGSGFQGQATNGQRKSIIGTVTKIHDKFCFIDNDIFCQLQLFRAAPRAGDRFHVEAEFNSQMPFKWNAIRVAPVNASASRNKPTGGSQNRAGGRGDSYDSRKRGPTSSGGQRSGGSSNYRGSGSSYHGSQSQQSNYRRDDRHVKSTNHLPYSVGKKVLDAGDLHQRYNKKSGIPGFIEKTNAHMWESFKNEKVFNYFAPEGKLSMYIPRCDGELNDFKEDAAPEDENTRYNARVLLLAGPGHEAIYDQAAKLNPKNRNHIDNKNQSVLKSIQVVTQHAKGNNYLPGGAWSESLDGENPMENDQTLINTAVRHVKKQLGIDLSKCKHWYRFLDCHYNRKTETDDESGLTAIYVPSTVDLMPNEDEWKSATEQFEQLLEAALTPPVEEEQMETDDKPAEEIKENGDAKEETAEDDTAEDAAEEETAEDEKADDEKADDEKADGEEESEENELFDMDLTKLKVAELKSYLQDADLSVKGKKQELIDRLQEHVDAEKAKKDEDKSDVQDKVKDTKEEADDKMETTEGDDVKEEAEKEEVEKEDVEKDEDQVAEKEKAKKPGMSEREKEAFRRKYKLPAVPSILLHVKHTDLNIQIISLKSLITSKGSTNYEENKREVSFEAYVVGELINEGFQRDFTRILYDGLNMAAGFAAVRKVKREEEEQKRKEEREAKKKADEEKKEAEKKAKEEAAAKEAEKMKEKEDESSQNEAIEAEHDGSVTTADDEKVEEKEEIEKTEDKVEEEEESGEPEAKKTKTEETAEEKTEEKTEEKKDEKKNEEVEKPKYKVDRNLMVACGYFDETYSGYFRKSDLEDILIYGGLGLNRHSVKKLINDAEMGHSEKNYGRMISCIPIDHEYTPTDISETNTNLVDSSTVSSVDPDMLRQQMDSLSAARDAALDTATIYKQDVDKSKNDLSNSQNHVEKLQKRIKDQQQKLKEKSDENIKKIQELTKAHKEKISEGKTRESDLSKQVDDLEIKVKEGGATAKEDVEVDEKEEKMDE